MSPARKSSGKSVTARAAKAAKRPAKKSSNKSVKKPPQSMPYDQGKWARVYTRAAGERRYWLVKSEPDVFSFDDLLAAPKRTTSWDSVRNTGARNFLRDGMHVGDGVLYYHSNATPSAVVGLCTVVRAGYPDHTAFDPSHGYYDPASDPDTPTWFMVDVQADRALTRPVSLAEIKDEPSLQEMALVRVSRLSVVPVSAAEWNTVIAMSTRPAP